jgi:hypothetical protein
VFTVDKPLPTRLPDRADWWEIVRLVLLAACAGAAFVLAEAARVGGWPW